MVMLNLANENKWCHPTRLIIYLHAAPTAMSESKTMVVHVTIYSRFDYDYQPINMAATNNAKGSKISGRPVSATAPASSFGTADDDDSAGLCDVEEEGFVLETSEPEVVAEADDCVDSWLGVPEVVEEAAGDVFDPPTTELYSSLHTPTVWSGQQGS